MRQIKFRAWNDIDKKMCDNGVVTHRLSALLTSKNYHVMQFTGLTDINGVEIYEGDIVSVDGSGACEVKICSYWGVVYVDSDGYDRQHADCVSEQDYPTIIGNIHQNPELLK